MTNFAFQMTEDSVSECHEEGWWRLTEHRWSCTVTNDRKITNKPQLVNFNSPQTKNTPQLFLFPALRLTDLKPTQTHDNHGCRPSNSLISDRVTTWVVGVWRCPRSDLLGDIRDTKTNSLPRKTYWRMKRVKRCWRGGGTKQLKHD